MLEKVQNSIYLKYYFIAKNNKPLVGKALFIMCWTLFSKSDFPLLLNIYFVNYLYKIDLVFILFGMVLPASF